MKDNENNNSSNDSLGVWNNPELEARLVAMLMGELSPYEEAEMEVELERSPELRLFRGRMEEVLGLISEVGQEVEDESGDDEWKMSGERRGGLLEKISSEKVERAGVVEVSTGGFQWRNIFSVAACLLISFGAFVMMFLRRGDVYKSQEELITYSAASEVDEEIVKPVLGENAWAFSKEKDISNLSGGIEIVGGTSVVLDAMTKGKKREFLYPTEYDSHEGKISKPEMNSEVAKKPSAPGSSMAKVIASSSRFTVPVPSVKLDEPSLDFGDGDEFGDGWGVGSSGGEQLAFRSKSVDVRQSNVEELGFDWVVDPMNVNSASQLAWRGAVENETLGLNGMATGGNRSGDYAISKDSVDAFLNNPVKGRSSGDFFKQEIARRAVNIEDADKELMDGRKAYSDKNYQGAVDKYKSALNQLPQGPIAEERRREYKGHLLDGSVALSQEMRRTGRYAEASGLLEGILDEDPGNVVARKHLEYLDDPIRTSGTVVKGHVENVEKVRKSLYKGNSYFDQAQFDDAIVEYKETLRLDPYNKAARRGMDKVNAAKSDYYRAAYDQTRASMLQQVDEAWEIEMPPVEEKKYTRGVKSEALAVGGKRDVEMLTESGIDARRLASIEEFKEKRREQEDKVEDHRTRLYALSKKLQIPYHGKDSRFYAGRDSDASEHDRADQAYEEAKRTKDQLESFTESLEGLNNEDLAVLLMASGRPEAAVLRADYSNFTELKQAKNMALAGGLAAGHHKVKSLDASIKEVEERLERSQVNVRKKLKEDLVVFEKNVEKLRLDSAKEVGDLIVSAEEKTRFGKVREDYERELAILEIIKKGSFGEELVDAIDIKKLAKNVAPDFSKEISAGVQTHSTFSLNVSDVSYQLAKSILLEKGGMPEADKVRVEEFVNAFDYGDPGACGQKVNAVVEQCVHPFYQQRNLMRVGMKTGAIGRSQPLRLTVLLDNSGSMERADRKATVLKSVEALASQLGPEDEVTLLSFARGARLVAQKVKGSEAMKLVALVRGIPSEGGTNLSRSIEQAYAIAKETVKEGTMSRIVLITDGAANLGDADPEELSKSIARMRQKGIAFDACGVGADGLDDEMLEALTRKGDGRYYFINKPEDADAGFAQKLAGALRPAAQNVKVQVVFNPERVGNYRLVGFEKHRLKKQDFRNDAVDAAEMAAEEAGNALYQVEARADGSGDVGTVFVRFRDMASGEMVERSWVIPYEANTPKLSSAAPSMQLAATAGMLGERLKLGDEGGIDLKQMRDVYGKLRSHYQADEEVQDLLRMCEKVIR